MTKIPVNSCYNLSSMDLLHFKRIIRSGWQNFYQDRSLLASTLSIMVVVLFLISVLLFSQQMTQTLVGELQHKMDISVYFKQDVQSGEITQVKSDLKKLPEVKEVNYTSKEEAMESFKGTFNNNKSLMKSLEVVGVNPFLASLNIKAFGKEQYDKIANYLNKDSYQKLIDHTNYNQTKETISKVFSISSAVRTGMLSLSVVLAFIAALIAFNTIRLSIVNRKDEISIMKLVGAKSWFVRGPFLVQGALIGVFAAVITAVLFAGGLFLLSTNVQSLLPSVNLFAMFASNFYLFFLVQLTTGVVLTTLSSFVATRKYLQV